MADPLPPPKWAIADTHFLLEDLRYRPPEADGVIITRWRQLVGPDDVVYHLGDVGLGSDSHRAALRDLLASLPGRVILTPGNWDTDQVSEICRQVGWTIHREGIYLDLKSWMVELGHYPDPELPDRFLSVHGHHHPPGRPPYERNWRFINVAANLNAWAPVPILDVITARLASHGGASRQ